MKWYHYLFLFLILSAYLLFRIGWLSTIEFGYDQPMLAARVLDFIQDPTYIKSFNYVIYNPWGYPSWGPGQIFFWVPFLLLSKNPLTISILIAIFNILSILLVFCVGKKYISINAGLISAAFLAMHPWWIVFSRMIYEPTPVATLVALGILLTFILLKNPKTKTISLLLILLMYLFQVYIHTITFILPVFGVIVINLKKINIKHFLLGVIGCLTLFLPIANYFSYNPAHAFDFIDVAQKFTQMRQDNPYSIKDITTEFLGIIGGGRFVWQLGYGYQDFIKTYPITSKAEIVGTAFAMFVLGYHIYKAIFVKQKRINRILLLFWVIGPIWFLTVIKTPIALPRFFLSSLPPLSLLIGMMAAELYEKINKLKLIPFILGAGILFYWAIFIVKYYSFIEGYRYDNGFLSSYSDIPFSFLDKSFKWILNDSQNRGYKEITVSNDINNKYSFSLNQSLNYYWKYYLGNDVRITGNKVGHYMIIFSSINEPRPEFSDKYGPYVVFRVEE